MNSTGAYSEEAVIGFEQSRFYYGGEVSFEQLKPARERLRKVRGEGRRSSTSQWSRSLVGDFEDASPGDVTR